MLSYWPNFYMRCEKIWIYNLFIIYIIVLLNIFLLIILIDLFYIFRYPRKVPVFRMRQMWGEISSEVNFVQTQSLKA